MADDLTVQQATDLARYFLGPDWFAMQFGAPGHAGQRRHPSHLLTSDGHGSHAGESWRAVFRAAGVELPIGQRYSPVGLRVMRGEQAVCTAVSATMAKRIAAALNSHITNRRGI